MKPVILISASEDDGDEKTLARFALYKKYAEAITSAGGIPIIAAGADAREYCELADGLLLSGGYDIDPSYFNRTAPEGCALKIQPERDKTELNLFSAFFAADKPILGICRGLQLINVALGGSLIMDIPQQLGKEHMGVEHEVEFKQGTMMHNLLGERAVTNSLHHQAAEQVGHGLIVSGQSGDGIIEAIEHEQKPVLGVQFHPERMRGMNILFSHLVHLCMRV